MVDSPYQAPQADLHQQDVRYVGFWLRVVAAVVDSLLLLAVLMPLIGVVYGWDAVLGGTSPSGVLAVILNWILPAVIVIVFWKYKSATPGKMVIGAKIVDATTGDEPSSGELIGRYLGYYVSMLPLLLGLFWVGWDSRKQGFHDKLAGTVVVKGRG